MKRELAYLSIVILAIGFILNGFLSLYSRIYADILGTIAYILFLILSYLYLWKDAWKLYLIGMLIGFVYEFIGVSTGIPFGSYHYTGFKTTIIRVPIPISMAWGTYLTVTYLTASSLINDVKWRKYLLTSLFMIIIDLAADPIMVSNNLWRWNTYIYLSWFGIPITNYLGWIVVSLTALYLYGKIGEEPKKISALKISPIAYISIFITFVPLVTNESLAPFIISLTIAVVIILYLYKRGHTFLTST